MYPRLYLLVVAICALLFQSQIAAQQRWRDRDGYTYEVYDVYTNPVQGHYPQQQQQHQQQYVQQNQQYLYYPRQQTSTLSVAEAQWVCTNTKTNDVMIIATDDIPRLFGDQTQQPTYPQQQPTYTQLSNYPQQPNYPQQKPNYPQHPNYPSQQPAVTPATTTTTTSEEPRPVWPGETTQKPSVPGFTTVGSVWSGGADGNKPGFTVVAGTPKPQPLPPSGPSEPLKSQLQPTKPSQNESDDYGDIEIVMGKK